MTYYPEELVLFGCGNMAGAMLEGWLNKGVSETAFTIIDPFPNPNPKLQNIRRIDNASQYQGFARAIMLGVKPQMLKDLAPAIAPLIGPDTILISMLAGIECATLKALFPAANPVRIMPNLAASLNAAPVGLYADALTDAEKAQLTGWFDALGKAVWLAQESEMALFTALAGSGPAYVYRFIDALAKGAEKLGMSAKSAQDIALTMVEGAAMLAARSDAPPGELADRVASPGGSTREGMNVLDADDALIKLATATLDAARRRNIELARMAD